jgi:O-antigen/teichoic acid export membrane protein
MSEEKSSYRQIMKATSILGSVQVVQIVIGIIRSKFIAVFLGTAGMGVTGLYTSALSLIQGLTSFGLSSSAIKNIAESHSTGDLEKIGKTVSIFKKLVWFTGFLGLIVTIFLSPLLSKYSFGNYDFTIPFVLLSVTLLLQQITNGYNVILQGTRRISLLAKAGIWGSIFGLIFTIPLCYYFGVNGILPILILNSLTSLLLAWWFSKNIKFKEYQISFLDALRQGNNMIKMGIVMSLNNFIVLGISYLVRVYINYEGSIEEVGLYSAGSAIVTMYVGLIFSAMTSDYYPRLAAANNDNKKSVDIVNKQAELAIIIIAPFLLIFLVFMPLVITILYSKQFIDTKGYIEWAIVGMIFKTVGWAIAYQLIAKGHTKVFIINEIFANCYVLISNILGYKFWGLTGLGIAFTFSYFIYMIQVFIVTNHNYNFQISRALKKVFGLQLICLIVCFGVVQTLETFWLYFAGISLIILSFSFSLFELNKRIDIVNLIKSSISNFRK